MNEEKKLYILLGIIVSVIVLLFGIIFLNEHNSKKYLEKFEEAFNGEEQEMVLLARENCSYCQMFNPLLDYMAEKYNFEYLYVDTNKLTNKALSTVLEKIKVDEDDFGTPHLTLVKSGTVIGDIPGYADEQKLLEFLKKHGYAGENEVSPLNYLSFESYKETIKSSTPEVIVIGQESCGYCMMVKPVLLSIADKYNVKINYLNMTELNNSENSKEILTEFNTSLAYLSEEEWGTPLMLIVKDNQVVGHYNGYGSEENYIKFLKEQGIIGE